MPLRANSSGDRPIAVLLLAALVALAGCGGGVSPGTDSPDATAASPADDATPSPSPTRSPTSTDTPTPSPTRTATPTATSTPTPSASERLGPFAVYGRNLRNASSYTVAYAIETAGGENATITGTVRANLDRATLYQTLNVSSEGGDSASAYYRPPGSQFLYTQLRVGGQVDYRRQNATSADVSVFSNPVRAVTSASIEEPPDFRDAGTVATDGGPRRKFVIDRPDRLPPSVRENYAEIRSVSWVVLVDEDRGYVTDVTYELTFVRRQGGDPRTVAFDLAYSGFGSTTVPQPDWLDAARNRTG
jgi:hypothetical protein